jgi:hypothetical protein
MPVSTRSRQARAAVLQAPDAAGRPQTLLPIRRHQPPSPALPRYVHLLTGTETLEYLAWRSQGASEVWWRLADGNPLRFPLDWRPGERVDVVSLGSPGQIQRDRRF